MAVGELVEERLRGTAGEQRRQMRPATAGTGGGDVGIAREEMGIEQSLRERREREKEEWLGRLTDSSQS